MRAHHIHLFWNVLPVRPTWRLDYQRLRRNAARLGACGTIKRPTVGRGYGSVQVWGEEDMDQAYTKTVEEVFKHFSVTEAEGLSATEVVKQRQKFGHNG